MKKIWEWINKNITVICCICLVLFMFRTCSTNSNIKRLTKEIKQTELVIDSIQQNQITQKEFEKALKIEGLKAEKRMIQSTDRKKFDLERENVIDAELEKLESQK